MVIRKQIIERVIAKTKADELKWRQTGKRNGEDSYITLASKGDVHVLFEGELIFTNPMGEGRFTIDIEAVDESGLAEDLVTEILSSIDRQVPSWVVDGLWPNRQEE